MSIANALATRLVANANAEEGQMGEPEDDFDGHGGSPRSSRDNGEHFKRLGDASRGECKCGGVGVGLHGYHYPGGSGCKFLPECPGTGKCHGPVQWCAACGDVTHVCDARRAGMRCDQHPVPPDLAFIYYLREQAKETIAAGERMIDEGRASLAQAQEMYQARQAFDAEVAADERIP